MRAVYVASLAGSENDAKAVAWAKAKFTELGFDRVYTDPVISPITLNEV